MRDGERNSKMTSGAIEAALDALRHGCTRRAAAGAAQVTTTTFYRWLDDLMFRDEVEKAEQQAEAAFSKIVADAAAPRWQGHRFVRPDEGRRCVECGRGPNATEHSLIPGQWTAAAWWLERRKWQDYGRHERVEVTLDVRKEAERLAAELGIDSADAIAEAERILAESHS